jgi:hypothetical protein
MKRVLSIDPGFVNCGVVLAEVSQSGYKVVKRGTLSLFPTDSRDPAAYHRVADDLFTKFAPIDETIIESVYTPWSRSGGVKTSDFIFRLGLLVMALYGSSKVHTKGTTHLIMPGVAKRKFGIESKPKSILFARSLFTDEKRALQVVHTDHVADCLNMIHYTFNCNSSKPFN